MAWHSSKRGMNLKSHIFKRSNKPIIYRSLFCRWVQHLGRTSSLNPACCPQQDSVRAMRDHPRKLWPCVTSRLWLNHRRPMESMTKGWFEQSDIKVSCPSELLWASLIGVCSVRVPLRSWEAWAAAGPDLRVCADCRVMFSFRCTRSWSGLSCQEASVCACPLSNISCQL